MKQQQFLYTRLLFILLFSISLTHAGNLCAQGRNARFNAYINTYSELAVEQMKKHKVPASITLAQGILESGAGQSELARKSHNHFGIKCGSNWKGRTVRHTDDARNECFRAYKHPRESYEDHSVFLANGARYSFLFKLDITDYKGWAKGLKKAGYATDPSYANRLITIIEDYELYKYDSKKSKHPSISSGNKKAGAAAAVVTMLHQIYLANDIAYVVARQGDTFKSIAKETGIGWRKLVKYNDLHNGYTLEQGDIIYLKQKNKKAAKGYTVHIVKEGESMHTIAQAYGIRLKNLYKMNGKDADYIPLVGHRLRLR